MNKLKKDEIEKILYNWNIGKIISFKKAAKGIVNHNWIVKTAYKKYVLRKTPSFKKLKKIEFELMYLSYLKNNGIKYEVPSPIKTKNGKKLIKTKDGIFWLYEFIQGKQINNYNNDRLRKVAEMLISRGAGNLQFLKL